MSGQYQVQIGLERLLQEKSWQQRCRGQLAYLCHPASVDGGFIHGLYHLKKMFPSRLIKVFGPQHGFVGDVQDNMIESPHFHHPYFDLPVYSLYSEVRAPTEEMLAGVDTVIVDLQDVGTRVYTYLYTLSYMLEACHRQGIQVVVLDRPNPVGGAILEGTTLDPAYASFVGRHPLPMRHGLTLGEFALWVREHLKLTQLELTVVPLQGWQREMMWTDTGRPWVLPSPNLPTPEGALTFVGTVLFEGTNISEGRGTTRPLEILGHPALGPFQWVEELTPKLAREQLEGFVLRPLIFRPTFQKHAQHSCGGVQVHVTDPQRLRPWRLGQWLCRELYHTLGAEFAWSDPPYEYEYHKKPIDLINGGERLRHWVEERGDLATLIAWEESDTQAFEQQRRPFLLYE